MAHTLGFGPARSPTSARNSSSHPPKSPFPPPSGMKPTFLASKVERANQRRQARPSSAGTGATNGNFQPLKSSPLSAARPISAYLDIDDLPAHVPVPWSPGSHSPTSKAPKSSFGNLSSQTELGMLSPRLRTTSTTSLASNSSGIQGQEPRRLRKVSRPDRIQEGTMPRLPNASSTSVNSKNDSEQPRRLRKTSRPDLVRPVMVKDVSSPVASEGAGLSKSASSWTLNKGRRSSYQPPPPPNAASKTKHKPSRSIVQIISNYFRPTKKQPQYGAVDNTPSSTSGSSGSLKHGRSTSLLNHGAEAGYRDSRQPWQQYATVQTRG